MNKLIVESKNDKIFVEKILKILNFQNIEVSEPICLIDECICLDGLGVTTVNGNYCTAGIKK